MLKKAIKAAIFYCDSRYRSCDAESIGKGLAVPSWPHGAADYGLFSSRPPSSLCLSGNALNSER